MGKCTGLLRNNLPLAKLHIINSIIILSVLMQKLLDYVSFNFIWYQGPPGASEGRTRKKGDGLRVGHEKKSDGFRVGHNFKSDVPRVGTYFQSDVPGGLSEVSPSGSISLLHHNIRICRNHKRFSVFPALSDLEEL